MPEEPAQLPVRMQAEQQGGTHTISLIGALHGELEPLLALQGIVPLDDLAAKLADRGIPAGLMTLGKLGTDAPDVHPLDAGDLFHGRQQAGAAVSAGGRRHQRADL